MRPRLTLRLPGFAPRCPVHTPQAHFRVLWCNARPENGRACTRRWLVQSPSPEAFAEALKERAAHQELCAGGLFVAAGI